MSADARAHDDLVFVGGTGRSGTHVLGRLLGRHPRLAGVPIECRFHCNKRGMPDLLGGRVTLAGFVEKLRDFWWHRVRIDGEPRGLHNVREAQTLLRIFPEARFVHAVRDGRDAASSVTTKTWGPDGIAAGIDWWADRLRAIDAGVRGEEDGSAYALPPERLCVVVLDELVGGDREENYARLAGFVGAEGDSAMRDFFDRRM